MKIVEVCCGSYFDALVAYKAGVKRIELNSALHLGGLTPSISALRLCKTNTDLKVISMLRPRGAGFNYNDEDYKTMLMDAELLMQNGSDGIAFGILNSNRQIDATRCKEIISIIKKYNGEAVFHRAFDIVGDVDSAIKTLINLGFDRVLTSGLNSNAVYGKEIIKYLQAEYGDKIEILAGCGINEKNAKELMEYTGISQIHSSCKAWRDDNTTSSGYVSFAYNDADNYDVVSLDKVKQLIDSIK